MTFIEFLLTVALLWCMGCLMWPAWNKRVALANRRACYVMQQSIEVAVSQYNEANASAPIMELTSANLDILVDQEYLEDFPKDPGEGSDTWGHYKLRGDTVTCTVHGDAPATQESAGEETSASTPSTEP